MTELNLNKIYPSGIQKTKLNEKLDMGKMKPNGQAGGKKAYLEVSSMSKELQLGNRENLESSYKWK